MIAKKIGRPKKWLNNEREREIEGAADMGH